MSKEKITEIRNKIKITRKILRGERSLEIILDKLNNIWNSFNIDYSIFSKNCSFNSRFDSSRWESFAFSQKQDSSSLAGYNDKNPWIRVYQEIKNILSSNKTEPEIVKELQVSISWFYSDTRRNDWLHGV